MKHINAFKKVISLLLAVTVFASCIPAAPFLAFAVTPTKTNITDTETFEYLIEKVEKETSPYIAARLRLLIYGDSTSNQYAVGDSFPSSSSYQTLKDGETGQKVAFKSAQCYAYAEWAFYKFFGFSRYNTGAGVDFVFKHEQKSFTESNFKAALQDAKCGTHVRIANKVSGYQHSITFLTHDEDGTGFYYLEGTGNGSGGYMVKLSHATYAAFATAYKNKKLNYIQLPEVYPESDENDQLTIDHAKIPVNVKTGEAFDVIGTTVMSDCKITSITAGVYTTSGTEKFAANVTPNCAAYRFGYIADAFFEFSSLSAGTYVYKIYAKDESGSEISFERKFTVSSSAAQFITETVHSFEVTPFDEIKYYEVDEDAHIYTTPEESDDYTVIKAGTVVQATGSYTDEDGTVWLQIGHRKWVKQGLFKDHTHSVSKTGLCTAEGCEYDSTPKSTPITQTSLATISSASVMSRPYHEEASKLQSVDKYTLITFKAKVTNLLGETWYETSHGGFVSAEALSAVNKISVASLPNKTEYVIEEKLEDAGISVKVELANGLSYNVTSGLSYSYSFSAIGTASVTVTYGGKSTSFNCVVKPVSGKETYKVTTEDGDPLNIREGPGTDYDKTSNQYANGAVITVTEIQKSGNYTWGKTDKGWVALDYCTYVSGYLYEIKFDLNGVEGEINAIYKAYGKDVAIPSDIPESESFEFAGWAESASATEPDFLAGGKYTANASATLYAVWKPLGTPVSGSVTISGTAVYGNKLTMKVSSLNPSNAEYNIYWLRDGSVISGATGTAYTLTQNDIGCKISVRIVGKNGFSGIITSTALTVSKKAGSSVSAPTLSSHTYTSITVKAVSGAEYSLNGTTWQASNVFSGLNENTEYTVYIRIAETATTAAGQAASAKLKTKAKVPTSLSSSKYTVNSSKKTVSKIAEKQKVSDFIKNFGETDFITVKTADGKEVSSDSYIGTGMKIVLGDDETVTAEYTVIVTGDINGDGRINVSDMVAAKADILGTKTLTGNELLSADINGDGKVNVTDFVAIKSHILDKSAITPRAV